MKGTKAMVKDRTEMVLNRTWRPFVELVGIDGVPACDKGGNVLRPYTQAKLSLRIPPTANPEKCAAQLEKLMTEQPPHGAKVTFTGDKPGAGWDAPPLAGWLEQACAKASKTFFHKDCVYMGEGGTIPFMGMLGEKFPEAQFMITGVLGPQSNAHGPNEFLHIPMGKRLTASVAMVLEEHLARPRGGKKSGGGKSKLPKVEKPPKAEKVKKAKKGKQE
jgi:acetylornithine deacetylase/succinyl-diaminopimelate desuccinylase-like protein